MANNGARRAVDIKGNGSGLKSRPGPGERGSGARGLRVCDRSRDFVVDYMNRHAHPVNAALHVVGVPAAFTGFYYLFSGKNVSRGGLLIFLGYLLQYLGHRAQGNEVGEVTLAKSIYKRFSSSRLD